LSPLLYIIISSTKLVIRAEQDLPGTEGGRGEKWEKEAEWRNDPNNVCTRE
jgi:hypothetical protein